MKINRTFQRIQVNFSYYQSYFIRLDLDVGDHLAKVRTLYWAVNGNFKHDKIWQEQITLHRGTHMKGIRQAAAEVLIKGAGLEFRTQATLWMTKVHTTMPNLVSLSVFGEQLNFEWSHPSWKKYMRLSLNLTEKGNIKSVDNFNFPRKFTYPLFREGVLSSSTHDVIENKIEKVNRKFLTKESLQQLDKDRQALFKLTRSFLKGSSMFQEELRKQLNTRLGRL